MSSAHVAIYFLIVTCFIVVHGDFDEKICDVRMWYLDLVTEGHLSGELSSTRKTLKTKIEKMIEKYKDGVDCKILAMYDDLLKTSEPLKTSEKDAAKLKENKVDGKTSGTKGKSSETSSSPKDDTDFDDTDLDDENSLATETESDQSKSAKIISNVDSKVGTTEENKQKEDKQDDLVSNESKASGEEVEKDEYVFDPRKGFVKVSKKVNNPDEKPSDKKDVETEKQTASDEKNSVEKSAQKSLDEKNKIETPTQKSSETKRNVETSKQSSSDEKRDTEKSKQKLSEKKSDGEPSKQKSSEFNSNLEASKKQETGSKEKPPTDKTKEQVPEQDKESSAKDEIHGSIGREPETAKGYAEKDTKTQNESRKEGRTEQKKNEVDTDAWRDSDESDFSTLELITDTCSQEDQCHHLCYYAFANGKCIEHYPDIIYKPTRLTQASRTQGSASLPNKKHQDDVVLLHSKLPEVNNADKSSLPSAKDKDTKENEINLKEEVNVVTESVKVDTKRKDGVSVEESSSSNTESGENKDMKSKDSVSAQASGSNTDSGEHKEDTKSKDSVSGQSSGSNTDSGEHKEDTKSKDSVSAQASGSKTDSGEHKEETKRKDSVSAQASSSNTDSERVDVEEHQTKTRSGNEFRKHEEAAQQQANLRDFTADLHKFELLFQQRVNEYGNKIQALEIMIMKLENQLLSEHVTKQNDSNSFSRLENQILKLENELLKLNQSYVTLKEENDILRTRHGKYLELGHDQSKQQIAANSTKHYELIAQQQSKISELNFLLRNHSNLFQKIQSRSNHLEEQNQILYQIVMNQTALISNIMKKVHELAEENIKQRQETQEMKTRMEFGATSDRLLEKLDNLVSGSSNIYKNVVDDGRTRQSSSNFIKHFPKLPHANFETKACGSKRPRYCMLFSFILSPCPPHSVIHWSKCTYIFKDISQEHSQGDQSKGENTMQNSRIVKDEVNVVHNKQSLNQKTKEHTLDKVASKEPKRTVEAKVQASSKPEKSSVTQKKESVNTKAAGDSSKPDSTSEEKPVVKVEELKRKILYVPGDDLPNYKDCYGYYQDGSVRNGMYKIYVVGLQKVVSVYCDMKGGGWTVLYKRVGGNMDFFKGWEDYKNGFGGLYSDHWIGLDNIHYLTNQDHYSMKVDLTDFDWEQAYAEYEDFWIDDESELYRLHIDKYSGNAGDGFEKHNNMKFTTFDKDNDLVKLELMDYDHNCAKRFKGGWWYYKCYMANPTGVYYKRGVHATRFDGIAWKPWRKAYVSMKEVVMKIRPISAYHD